MARKHLLSDLVGQKLSAGNSEGNVDPDVVAPQYSPRGAIGAVSRSIELLKSQSLTELDPELIDASLVADRLDESPGEFEEFARQIKENGQQVPILVRPHPDVEGRYQIAYGRRRLRAAKAAGILVKAAVRSLSDDDLVLAQGQENSARQDLSFIERAFYAAELESSGFQRPLIMAALAIDKSGLSRLIAAAKQLPADVIRAIGPAPKAGRDRWGEFSVRLEQKGALEKIRELLSSDAVTGLSSDDRFARLFDAIAPKKQKSPKAQVWKAEDGTKAARYKQDAKTLTLTIDKEAAPDFSDYLLSALPEIYASFKRTKQ